MPSFALIGKHTQAPPAGRGRTRRWPPRTLPIRRACGTPCPCNHKEAV